MPINNFTPSWMTAEHSMLLDSATRFFKEQWGPKDEAWRAAGMMDRQAWLDAGANGFLCASMPEAYGGGGGDFGHEAVLILAQGAAGDRRLWRFAALGHRRALHPALRHRSSKSSAGCRSWPAAS